VSVRFVIGLMIVGVARQAAAERVIDVDATGAPFEARDLVAAIRVRAAIEGAPVHLLVTSIDHGVRVAARGGVREVDLNGLTGTAAARLVALAANDLFLDDLAMAPLAEHRPAVMAAPPSLGVLGAAAGWGGVLGDLSIDFVVPRDGWLAAIELGGGQLVNSSVKLTAGVIRPSVGMRMASGLLELRGGLTVVPLMVSTGVGDRTVLFGAGASARLRVPVSEGVRGVLAVGIDAFANRTQYQVIGMPTVATPQIAPWVAAGVEVGL
jgi:hypothetical protein